jgi:mono/diheme cytochrome c family protein
VLLAAASLAGGSLQTKKQKKPTKPAVQKTTPAKPAAGGDAAALIAQGKKIYDAQGCAGCHIIDGKGGAVGPNLSATGGVAGHDAKWLSDHVLNPKTHNPNSTMPAYQGKIKGGEIAAIGSFLSSLKGAAGGGGGPVVKLAKPDPKIIAAIEKAGGSVREIAQNDAHLEVSYKLAQNVTDATIAPLAKLINVVQLDLGKTGITDAGLVHVKGLTDLVDLHLENTKIGDKGLAHIAGLKKLEYLNVYGTQVTDAGLDHLKGLSNLKKLFVWQSKVTKEGADKLKQALPKLDINLGL